MFLFFDNSHELLFSDYSPVLLQPQGPSCCASNTPGTYPPQDLCTSCSFYLAHPSHRGPRASLPQVLHVLAKRYLLHQAYPVSLLKTEANTQILPFTQLQTPVPSSMIPFPTALIPTYQPHSLLIYGASLQVWAYVSLLVCTYVCVCVHERTYTRSPLHKNTRRLSTLLCFSCLMVCRKVVLTGMFRGRWVVAVVFSKCSLWVG